MRLVAAVVLVVVALTLSGCAKRSFVSVYDEQVLIEAIEELTTASVEFSEDVDVREDGWGGDCSGMAAAACPSVTRGWTSSSVAYDAATEMVDEAVANGWEIIDEADEGCTDTGRCSGLLSRGDLMLQVFASDSAPDDEAGGFVRTWYSATG